MSQQERQALWRTLVPCFAVGQIAAVYAALRNGLLADPTAWAKACFAGLAIGGWTFLCVWTWQRLLRRRNPETGRVTYDSAVLGWGLPMWATMAVLTTQREMAGQAELLSAPYIGELLRNAVIGFPIWLWGGHLFGRAFEKLFSAMFRSSK
jgi:hypothetical protein